MMTTMLKAKMTLLALIGLTALTVAGGVGAMAPAEAEAAMMVTWTCQYVGGGMYSCKKEYFMV
ncbi:MAG: hypothetical protein M3Q71_05855 [Chloroflexota bacterium]|nr:hypothetical protein [Chloroflexota bacterium]MDP9470182.1 hypothetical protein [Chloroflexota bacterium]